MRRSYRWALVLLGLLAGTAQAAPPPVLGLELGRTTLAEALVELGPAAAAALAGHDSEGGATAADPIELVYRRPFRLEREHPVRLVLRFEPQKLRLEAIQVDFHVDVPDTPSRLALAEVLAVYGPPTERIRLDWQDDEGGLEASLCRSPSADAPVLALVWRERGLVAYLFEVRTAPERVDLLEHTLAAARGEALAKPCSAP